VVGAGAAHEGLVEIVAHGIFVSELLQNRDVAILHVIEGHRIPAAVVIDCRRRIEGVDLVGVVSDYEGVEIAEAA